MPIYIWSKVLAWTDGFGAVQEVLVYLKISTHFKSPKNKFRVPFFFYGVRFTMALLYCKGCVWIMAFLGLWILTSPVVVYGVCSNCPPSVFTTIRAHFHLSPISRWRLFSPPGCVHVHVWSEDSGAVTFGRPVIQMHSILHHSTTDSNILHYLQVSPITVFYSGYHVSYIFSCILRNAKQL